MEGSRRRALLIKKRRAALFHIIGRRLLADFTIEVEDDLSDSFSSAVKKPTDPSPEQRAHEEGEGGREGGETEEFRELPLIRNSLKSIDVSSRNLSVVFLKELKHCSRLQILALENNQIRELNFGSTLENGQEFEERTSSIGRPFGQTTEINLSWNCLKTIPLEICAIRVLEHLWIASNELICIPEKIGNLKNLVFLELDYNMIEQIPLEIGKLEKLEKLWISNNQLCSIPDTIGQLGNSVTTSWKLSHLQLDLWVGFRS